MKKGIRNTGVLLTITWLSILLLACGNQAATPAAGADDSKVATETTETTTAVEETNEGETRIFKDWTGHEVEIPVNPKRVIYHGEVTGDLLALGVVPVGILRQEGTVFDDQVAQAEDVGFPISVEKALDLNPDLIIFSNSDKAQYDQIAKVAPTVTFDSFGLIEDRMRILGDLLNKKQEAEDWITAHQKATEEMWTQLHENGLKEGRLLRYSPCIPGIVCLSWRVQDCHSCYTEKTG